jgi:drug/metabolite transporter (DMT)-like permease
VYLQTGIIDQKKGFAGFCPPGGTMCPYMSVLMALNSRKILPYLALVSGVICLSFSALFVRWAQAPGPVVSFYRIGIATLVLAPLFWRQQKRIKRQLGASVLIFPLLGGIFTALDHAVWSSSLSFTTAANATLLGNTAPFWVALASWLVFREQLGGRFWIGLVFTLGGAATVLGSDFLRHPSFGMGDLLALASGFFYGCYFLVTQRGRQGLDTVSYVWLVSLVGSVGLLLVNLGLGYPLSGYPALSYLVFLGAALISQVGGYLSVSYALGHLPASVVSPSLLGQPVLTALLAIPLLGEGLRLEQGLGGLSVLLGVYLIHRSQGTAKPCAVNLGD